MDFKLFVRMLSIVQSAGVAILIGLRCQLDNDIDCTRLTGKSLSWLVDWSWIQTLAAVLFGGAAFLNIWFAFGVLYPCYKHPYNHWYIWLVRMLHAAGFFGVAVVGVFDLNEHNEWHMRAAFWLFIILSLECVVVLFIPENICNVQNLYRVTVKKEQNQEMDKLWDKNNYRIWFSIQAAHAVLIPAFAVLYVVEDYGPFEWISLWLILSYPVWFARDHQQDIVHTDLVSHPNCPHVMYAEFENSPIQLHSLHVKYRDKR